jgi:hypothetical protein
VQLHPAWRLRPCPVRLGGRLKGASIAHAVREEEEAMTTTDTILLIEAIAAVITAITQLIVAMRQGP